MGQSTWTAHIRPVSGLWSLWNPEVEATLNYLRRELMWWRGLKFKTPLDMGALEKLYSHIQRNLWGILFNHALWDDQNHILYSSEALSLLQILSHCFSFCFIWRNNSWMFSCFKAGRVIHCSLQKVWAEWKLTRLLQTSYQIIIKQAPKDPLPPMQTFINHVFISMQTLFCPFRCPNHIFKGLCKADPGLSRVQQDFIISRVATTNTTKPVAEHKTFKNQSSSAIPVGPPPMDFISCWFRCGKHFKIFCHCGQGTFKFMQESLFETFIMLVNRTLFSPIKIHFWHSLC